MRIGRAAFVTLGALVLSLAPLALGHPDDDMDRLRLAVASWANAAISRDAVTIRALLHDDFRGSGGWSKDAYLAMLVDDAGPPASRLLLRHAFYQATDEGFEVSPVIYTTESWLAAYTLKLTKVDGKWLLLSISATSLPAGAHPGELPEQRQLLDVRVRLRDATTNSQVAGRVHVVDSAGSGLHRAGSSWRT